MWMLKGYMLQEQLY
ncbi:hypothetical protein [Priestia abyssalis]